MTPAQIEKTIEGLSRDDIVGIECKHVGYSRSQHGNRNDLLTIKEIIHTKDNRRLPRLRFVQDYKRPFWMTKKAYRKPQQRKEWEYLNKLDKFESTQIRLTDTIVRVQGYGNPQSNLKMLARNPYLYGCDISPQALMKASYQERFQGLFTPNTVAVIDTETDVVNGSGEIPILATITFRDRAFVAINTAWLKESDTHREDIHKAINQHLAADVKERNLKVELFFSDKPGEMCYEVIKKAHEWQPDFVTFWNMDYDMTVILNALEKEGYDLADTFSDPRVPVEFKHFNYRRGPTMKVKADGTVENLASYDRWNVVECPASFYMIDAMCVYRQIRRAMGKFPSYSLDYTLETNLKRNKLYFDIGEIGKPGSIEWHVQMQLHHKIPYIVYNIFDCIGVELLDDKTKDLQTQISILSNMSEYDIFNSNPKRTSNELHFFCLKNGKVAGAVSDQMVEELDQYIQGTEDWIN